ncbi:guanylate-binding protein 1-like [Protopterus annectens]|uniref:guanylate-binding protein 1-like n=1 Tax=Protopterus annectens TaxID=7888 RepID=UPI001CF98232|nr:guanylate-binding protein 1-like [Protopterus annectens]
MEKLKGSSIPEMESPVCIIENSDGKLKPCEEGLKVLEQFDLPVIVVAIAGLYRTGKSYLMNRLCNQRKGFSLGSTVQSHTKGIWMWVIPHPKQTDCCLMVVDTEGLGDAEKGDENNDKWLFALAVLMSSLFVYNSMSNIDQHALSDLHFVTKLSDVIKIKTKKKENEKEDLGRIFPPFVWTIRDFTLDLEMDNKAITADEYLENCLKVRKEKKKEFNECRKCIKDFFPERKCFIFPQPVRKKDLRNLENLSDEELDEDFVTESKHFCDFVYKCATPKTVQGAQLNGRKLSTLLQAYTECISSGHVPSIQSAVQSLSEIENTRAVAAAEACYKELMDKVTLPTKDVYEFLKHHIQSEKEAIDAFTQQFFLDEDMKFQNEMKVKIQCLYDQYNSANEQASEKKCRAVLNEVAKELEEKLKEGEYVKPGGYTMYCFDRKCAEKAYLAVPGKGVKEAL